MGSGSWMGGGRSHGPGHLLHRAGEELLGHGHQHRGQAVEDHGQDPGEQLPVQLLLDIW